MAPMDQLSTSCDLLKLDVEGAEYLVRGHKLGPDGRTETVDPASLPVPTGSQNHVFVPA